MQRTPTRSLLPLLAAVLVCAGLAVAQTQFAELPVTDHWAPLASGTSIAAADFDGDGITDLVVGGARERLYLGDGQGGYVATAIGRFPERTSLPVDEMAIVLQAVDVDGDGDQDLVAGLFPGTSGCYIVLAVEAALYVNDGTGTFVDAGRFPGSFGTTAVASGDVDGDGDVDLVPGGQLRSWGSVVPGPTLLFRNDGAGSFTDVTVTNLPVLVQATQSIVLVDVDGDRDLDLVTGSAPGLHGPGGCSLALNDGQGRFTDVTSAQLPVGGQGAVAAADVDVDGDQDLVFGQSPTNGGRLYRNDGRGVFTDVTVGTLPHGAVAFPRTVNEGLGRLNDLDGGVIVPVDLDRDGDVDLLFGAQCFVNTGTGRFAEAELPPGLDGSVALADSDRDGYADVFCENGVRYLNGGGVLARASVPSLPRAPDFAYDVAIGDLDGDGDPDLVFPDQPYRLLFNDGHGSFDDRTDRVVGSNQMRIVSLADVDRDGDLDLFVGYSGWAYLGLFLNDGLGRFTEVTSTHVPVNVGAIVGMATGDVDGDGDLDVVVANQDGSSAYGQNQLLLNDGRGHFSDATAGHLPSRTDWTQGLALTDVDRDGDLDVVFANSGQDRLCLNDGTGVFTDSSSFPVDNLIGTGIACGDVDADGDVDLVIGTLDGPDRLYLGDGRGGFVDATAGRMPSTSSGSWNVAIGDLDDDGDLDLVLATQGGCDPGPPPSQIRALVNDGTGTFVDATASILPPYDEDTTEVVALADLDDDGDLDLLTGCPPMLCSGYGCEIPAPGPIHLFSNRLRQLRTPHLPRLGQSYDIEVHSSGGPTSFADVALPFLASRESRTTVPGIGILHLDPQALLPLPAVLIPQPAGVVRTTVPVPNNVALVGAELFGQALVLRFPNGAHLTNLTHDRILR